MTERQVEARQEVPLPRHQREHGRDAEVSLVHDSWRAIASQVGARVERAAAAPRSPWPKATVVMKVAFMWNIGAATITCDRRASSPCRSDDSQRPQLAVVVSGTPLGRPVEPEV